MKPIGGFLGLELGRQRGEYHHTALSFKSGRAAFNAILMYLKPRKVLVPFYCCDTLLQPLIQGGFHYEFYSINSSFEMDVLPKLAQDEVLLYVNYFDLKRTYVEQLSRRYGAQLVIDATQAFYMMGSGRSWLFNSCRKFFGVPDGAYLHTPAEFERKFPTPTTRNTEYIFDHLVRRLDGDLEHAYTLAKQNEALVDARLIAMSNVTKSLLSAVDYETAGETRRRNFQYLQDRLGNLNGLKIVKEYNGSVPLYFAFLPDKAIERHQLWGKKIFMPQLWADCLERAGDTFAFERQLSSYMLPLPIDQRYTDIDMKHVTDVVMTLYQAG
jgi:hypothetical protein